MTEHGSSDADVSAVSSAPSSAVSSASSAPDDQASYDTAVLLALPELAAFTSPWRSTSYAPDHPGLPIERRFPPHVTVLTPFARTDDTQALVRLRQVAARHEPLTLLFARVQQFDDAGPVWLKPEPEDAVRELVRDVLSTFPELPPYGGKHPDPTPHVTVTAAGDAEVLQQVRRALDEHGPLTARVTGLGVWARGEDAVWRQTAFIPLGADQPTVPTAPAVEPGPSGEPGPARPTS